MSTKQTTTGSDTSSLQFDPASQRMYNALIGGGSNVLQNYIKSPFGNAPYLLGAGQSQAGAQSAGGAMMQALSRNQGMQGLSGQAGAGWLGAQRAQAGRATGAMSSQASTSNVLAALQRQMMASGAGMSFSPQLTGQQGQFSQKQIQTGTGSWLPQLISSGVGLALMAAAA